MTRKKGQYHPVSPSPFAVQLTVSTGTREGHKIRSARWLDRFLINLGHDRTNSVIWLSFILIRILTHKIFQNSKFFYSKFKSSKFKMTKIKKTLGRNWTRYHNYYGMNSVLEAACTKQLHWDRAALREYTLNHAPEVNHQNASKHVQHPPPLPDNDDDAWFQSHSKLPGSGKHPESHHQSSPRRQRRRCREA